LKTGNVVVIGGGPAGLTAAYELARHGQASTVLERLPGVGGLSRTEEYKGYRFDIGGHRFFTRVGVVARMWREILGDEFLVRPRLSRIYYQGYFFQYPLDPLDALLGLGLWESLRCMASYGAAKLRKPGPQPDLESWLIFRFGMRLYQKFFESYTEKVWGVPCREIAAEWAAQRIRGLSIKVLVEQTAKSVLEKLGFARRGERPKTLIEEFEYPRLGPGQMWTATQRYLEDHGTQVRCGEQVTRIRWEPGRVLSVETVQGSFAGDHFLSTMPIRELIEALDPAPPAFLRAAAAQFNYRDFLTVALILKVPRSFPDNWIYIHEPAVKVGRIQNYKNWSPDMVPDPAMTCLGMEYFCFEGDGLWSASDDELIAQATRELEQLGLAKAGDVVDGRVLRVPKAYPVYDGAYKQGLATVREFLATVPNLQLIGRNGMHRYNNQDHSMLTGMLAARNILGLGKFDLWQVNADEDYHEDGFRVSSDEVAALEATQPATPELVRLGSAENGKPPPRDGGEGQDHGGQREPIAARGRFGGPGLAE